MKRSRLINSIREKRSFLCVGLDTDVDKIPAFFRELPDPLLSFNKMVIDATRDLCVAYKPNIAFYERLGPDGWRILQDTVHYIGDTHLIIADAKRGDIGNTSMYYADAFFNRYGFDAITVAPYMGKDSVMPFLAFEDKWTIVLGLTSNPGSADFQRLPLEHPANGFLYEEVISKVSEWGNSENLMFVTGATFPEAFQRVRKIVPDHFLLVPGVGAQGGDLQRLYRYGANKDVGLLVNSSRGIIYAGKGNGFEEISAGVRKAAGEIQSQMEHLLKETKTD